LTQQKSFLICWVFLLCKSGTSTSLTLLQLTKKTLFYSWHGLSSVRHTLSGCNGGRASKGRDRIVKDEFQGYEFTGEPWWIRLTYILLSLLTETQYVLQILSLQLMGRSWSITYDWFKRATWIRHTTIEYTQPMPFKLWTLFANGSRAIPFWEGRLILNPDIRGCAQRQASRTQQCLPGQLLFSELALSWNDISVLESEHI
jgi:hypothetical protein